MKSLGSLLFLLFLLLLLEQQQVLKKKKEPSAAHVRSVGHKTRQTWAKEQNIGLFTVTFLGHQSCLCISLSSFVPPSPPTECAHVRMQRRRRRAHFKSHPLPPPCCHLIPTACSCACGVVIMKNCRRKTTQESREAVKQYPTGQMHGRCLRSRSLTPKSDLLFCVQSHY